MAGDYPWLRLSARDVHLDARTLNHIIRQTLNRKTQSVTSNPMLRQLIGEAYLRAVKDYIPFKTGKLQDSGRATADGRVYWNAFYAVFQYENEDYNHPVRYSGHMPRAYWTDAVRPGTADWDRFVEDIKPLIIERMK